MSGYAIGVSGPPGGWTAFNESIRDPATATADVVQTSWCTWDVRVLHGLTQYGPDGHPWLVLGTRRRAERVARRKLAAYRRRLVRERDRDQRRTTIT